MSSEVTPSWRALSWMMSTFSTLPGSFQSRVGTSRCGLPPTMLAERQRVRAQRSAGRVR